MTNPHVDPPVDGANRSERTSESSSAVWPVGLVAGFFYALFAFSFGFFGVANVGLIAILLVGTVVALALARRADRRWRASLLAQCVGTAPYSLLLLLGDEQSLAGRLLNVMYMIGPAILGTVLAVLARNRASAA